MTEPIKEYRLDGIYRQRQEGYFMQRAKLPAGVLSSQQAVAIAETSIQYGKGEIHLTTRGSMEIHWLKEDDLQAVKRDFASVGLTSRGACGGAVRGVTCGSQGAVGFPAVELLARKIQRHFTANPRFERLPKKFKIGIEASDASRRHLIQDVGLLLSDVNESGLTYNLYVAGGLGREPQAGLLFEENLPETRIIPLIEAIINVYCKGGGSGKRLKHLLNQIGMDEFRKQVYAEPVAVEELPPQTGLSDCFVPVADDPKRRLVRKTFAGVLLAEELKWCAKLALEVGNGYLMVTADQDLAIHLAVDLNPQILEKAAMAGFAEPLDSDTPFRVCPGSDLCRMGLSATREVASKISALPFFAGSGKSYAISGCHNSCTQPQLADVGIVSSSLQKGENGDRTPRFDLYGNSGKTLGMPIKCGLTEDELLVALQAK